MRIFFVIILTWLYAVAIFEPSADACSLLTASASGFGSSDAGTDTGPLQAAAIETQGCITEYHIGLSGGQHLSGTRRMSDGAGHFINYFLWQDNGANVEWGTNGIAADIPYPADPLTATGNDGTSPHAVMGTALTRGASPPGVYTDLVQVTLIFSPYGPDDRIETDIVLSLRIIGTCSLNLSGLNGFGVWPTGASDLQGVSLGVFTVNCTPGLIFAVGMDAGQNFQNGFRNMRCGDNTISYILFADSGGGSPWGDAGLSLIDSKYTETHPDPAQKGMTTGTAQNFFVWGDAMISGKSPGVYTDVVNITVVWP